MTDNHRVVPLRLFEATGGLARWVRACSGRNSDSPSFAQFFIEELCSALKPARSFSSVLGEAGHVELSPLVLVFAV